MRFQLFLKLLVRRLNVILHTGDHHTFFRITHSGIWQMKNHHGPPPYIVNLFTKIVILPLVRLPIQSTGQHSLETCRRHGERGIDFPLFVKLRVNLASDPM